MNQSLEDYLNCLHSQNKVIYSGRSASKICPTCRQPTVNAGINIDVRNLITANDHFLEQIVKDNQLVGSGDDQTIWNIQKWIVANIRYVGDERNQGAVEHWQFPFETLASGIGDCEDGAILMCSLAIAAGIPNYKVRVTAGFVKPHEETAPEGGHAYVSYYSEETNKWYAIDWCFYQDSDLEVTKKKSLDSNPLYKEVWFSFNNQFSWGHKDFSIDKRIPETDLEQK